MKAGYTMEETVGRKRVGHGSGEERGRSRD